MKRKKRSRSQRHREEIEKFLRREQKYLKLKLYPHEAENLMWKYPISARKASEYTENGRFSYWITKKIR